MNHPNKPPIMKLDDVPATTRNYSEASQSPGASVIAMSLSDMAQVVSDNSLDPHPIDKPSSESAVLDHSRLASLPETASKKDELEYRKRTELSPNNNSQPLSLIESLHQTGLAYEKQGNLSEALRHFERALELSRQVWPTNGDDHANVVKATLNRIDSIHERQEARRKV